MKFTRRQFCSTLAIGSVAGSPSAVCAQGDQAADLVIIGGGLTTNPDNQHAFTMCFAVDHLPNENHVIDRPSEYKFWRDFVPKMTPPWPGRLLDFTYTHRDPVSQSDSASIRTLVHR